jgi:DNA topoisomerase I
VDKALSTENTLFPPMPAPDETGLVRQSVDDLSIRRQRRGKGFTYLDADGCPIRDKRQLLRFRSLAIPPAYREVRIASDPRSHIQAVGYDEAGRLQYRYHPDWQHVREHQKIDRLAAICASIRRIRRRIAKDIEQPLGSEAKALAAVVMLIDRTHIRIGSENYVHTGQSRGAATLLKRNVSIDGTAVRLSFRAKGGQNFSTAIRTGKLARALAELQTLRGRRMFQFRNGRGRTVPVTAAAVNAYLSDIAGASVTAKDFRTLAACAEAGCRLAALAPAEKPTPRRRQVAGVIRDVAELLGNTPAVVRKNYVHGCLLTAFEQGLLPELYAATAEASGSRRGEALVAMLIARLAEQNDGRTACN